MEIRYNLRRGDHLRGLDYGGERGKISRNLCRWSGLYCSVGCLRFWKYTPAKYVLKKNTDRCAKTTWPTDWISTSDVIK